MDRQHLGSMAGTVLFILMALAQHGKAQVQEDT
jgi:hypothetical protein